MMSARKRRAEKNRTHEAVRRAQFAREAKSMDAERSPVEPNWHKFYKTLLRLGPHALTGIPKQWVRWFQVDWFWTPYIWDAFDCAWYESPELAVEEAISQFVEAVQGALYDLPVADFESGWVSDPTSGGALSWSDCIDQIRCDVVPPRIRRALLNAASMP